MNYPDMMTIGIYLDQIGLGLSLMKNQINGFVFFYPEKDQLLNLNTSINSKTFTTH